MTIIMTGVANTGGRAASLNRFARWSGWATRVKEPLAPGGICLKTCPPYALRWHPRWRSRLLVAGTRGLIESLSTAVGSRLGSDIRHSGLEQVLSFHPTTNLDPPAQAPRGQPS